MALDSSATYGEYAGGWNATFAERRIPESSGGVTGFKVIAYPSSRTQFSVEHFIEKTNTPFGGLAPAFTGGIKKGPILPDPCQPKGLSLSGNEFRENYDQAYLKNKQYGYKTRTWDPNNLKGNFNFCGCSAGVPYYVTGFGNEGEFDNEVKVETFPLEINKKSTTYKYGMRGPAPNDGKDLPGALKVNLLRGEGRGQIIITHKNSGYSDYAGGAAGGYMAANWNENGMENLPSVG